MTTVGQVCEFLEQFAPLELAEDWDNVGLLVGDKSQPVRRVMTCLTVTPETAAEAAEQGAQLIVSHHPLPFRPLKRITSDTVTGQILLRLVGAGVAVASPHTAFDSAGGGINQMLAEGLGLKDPQPLIPADADPLRAAGLGAGRWGRWPSARPLRDVVSHVKQFLSIDRLHAVGDLDRPMNAAAVACGSAGQFLSDALSHGCDLLITGETSFHTCLEATANDACLLLTGHYASERFAVERLAAILADRFGDVEIWPSRQERDPVTWI